MGVILGELFLYGAIFFAGTFIYSFLNVVIYCVSKKESFSFSGGKWWCCERHISVRDRLVEILGGETLLFCIHKYERIEMALTVFAFFGIMTVVTFLDIDTMEIADGCHLAIVLLALISCFTMTGPVLLERLAGALCVSIPMLVLAMLVPGAFGGGDIKLMAACGLFLGWRSTLISTFFGFLFGGIWAAGLLITGNAKRKEHFAFGPFLCLGMGIGLI